MGRKHSRHVVGGYIWNAALRRATQANDRARKAIADVHNHITNPPNGLNIVLISQRLTDAALAIADNAAALAEIKAIANAQKG